MPIEHEEQPQAHQPHKSSNTRRRIHILEAAAVVVGVAVLLVAALQQHKRAAVINSAPNLNPEIVSQDEDEPEEGKPDTQTQSYEVAKDLPRRILIPSQNIDAFIQRVAITKDNAIAAPGNVHFGGWYVHSVLPGKSGVSIIDGHVSGKYVDGVFKQLHKLSIGDHFSIEFGDRTLKNFEVTDVQIIPTEQSIELLMHDDPNIDAQLNLITCGGRFDKDSQSYDDRVIIVSKLINS